MDGLLAISARAAAVAVGAAWEGLLLAAGVGLGLRLAPGLTAAVRSAIWTAVLVIVVGLHLGGLRGPDAGASATAGHGAMQVDVRWSVALAGLWAVCSLVRGAGLVRSALRLWRVARGATVVAVDAGCAALLGSGRRTAELCVSEAVDRPVVAGFLRPRILLPAELLKRLDARELEQIVLHEMEHLRRGDDWVNLGQKLCLAVFSLNPVLLWVERRVCAERELACDDRVLQATRAPKQYATCLANLAEDALVRRGISLALGAWERQTELARRVERILARPERTMGRLQARLATGAVVSAMLVGGAMLARSPELVSFAPAAAGGERVATAAGQMTTAGRVTGTVMTVAARRGMGSAVLGSGPGAGARAMLVPAVMRSSRNGEDVAAKSARVRSGARRRPRPGVAARWRAGAMLTGWRAPQASEAMPGQGARAVQAGAGVVRERRIRFAAVPFGDGWLVFQL